MSIRRFVLVGLAACLTTAAVAPSASAINPKYTKFEGCPDNPAVYLCVRAETTAGHFKIGNTDTPVNKTVVLSGGLTDSGPASNDLLTTSKGGLLGDPLEVPGGLTGLTGLSEFILNLITFGANKVYAKPVLVGNASLDGSFGLRLPVKINLINPFLKSGCSIGSSTNPIVMNLGVGPTSPPPPAKSISGRPPSSINNDPSDPNIIVATDMKHVDNAFAAPTASGCDLIGFGLINALVNFRAGLPSAAGLNEAILDHTNIYLIEPKYVYP